MTATAYFFSKRQILKPDPDDAGRLVPNENGTLEFYVSGGTSVHLATYSDAGLTSANTNPVVLDADGFAGYIFLKNEAYAVVCKDEDGNVLWQEDPVHKGRVRIKAAALPSVHWAGLEVHLTTNNHLNERNSDDTAWIDRGPIDSLGNASTTSAVLTGTATDSFVTPDALAAIWEENSVAVTATASIAIGEGGAFTVNGASTTINTFGTASNGRRIIVKFSTQQTVANGSGINTLSGSSMIFPAGSYAEFVKIGGTWEMMWWKPASARYAYRSRQTFTATGTYTRPAGVVLAFVRTVGPGGGGAASDTATASNGSAAAGGGSGGYCEEWCIPSATESVTIGTGGAAQTTAATAGNNGSGASSFGSFHSAGAGNGGAAMTNGSSGSISNGGTGGSATGGDLNINGQAGQYGSRVSTTSGQCVAGDGGNAPKGFGPGGRGAPGIGAALAGSDGVGYGAGGGGGGAHASGKGNGGAGKDGICIVDEYELV